MHTTKKIAILSTLLSPLTVCYIHQEISRTLSAQEADCLEWFEAKKTEVNWGFKNLSQEDQNVFKQGTAYSDDREKLTRVIRNFAAGFCAHASANKIALKHDEATIESMMLKRQNYIGARMFVFSQLLTPAERATIQRDNYLANPQAALEAMTQSGKLLAQELTRLKLIPDEDLAKEKIAQEFTQNKMAELERAYKSNEVAT